MRKYIFVVLTLALLGCNGGDDRATGPPPETLLPCGDTDIECLDLNWVDWECWFDSDGEVDHLITDGSEFSLQKQYMYPSGSKVLITFQGTVIDCCHGQIEWIIYPDEVDLNPPCKFNWCLASGGLEIWDGWLIVTNIYEARVDTYWPDIWAELIPCP